MLEGKNKSYVEYSDRPSRFMLDLNSEVEKRQELDQAEELSCSRKLRYKKKGREFFAGIFLFFKKIFVFFDKFFNSLRLVVLFIWRGPQWFFSQFKKINPKLCTLKIKKYFGSLNKKRKLRILEKKKSKKLEHTDIVSAKSKFSFFRLVKTPLIMGAVMLLLVLPFKIYTFAKSMLEVQGRVMGISEQAIKNLSSAKDSASKMDFLGAGASFNSAHENFLEAQAEIADISLFLNTVAKIIPNKKVQLASDAEAIIEAGVISTSLANHLSDALLSINVPDRSIKSVVESFYDEANLSLAEVQKLSIVVAKINSDNLPNEYQTQFLVLATKIEMLKKSLFEFVDILEKLKIFLGFDYDKKYLLVFQNNTELRASGGFVGSFAVIDFRNGEIKKIETPGGGSYDTEGGLHERIIAPKPLYLVNPLWHFWDSNWWPDWKKSAKKLKWFYEKSGGPTVDGVISFTPTILENILGVIGEIDMTKEYGVVINSDNFWVTVQAIAEQKNGPTNTPKKIIGDMFNKILKELPARLNKDVFLNLASTVERAFAEKQALVYFEDDVLQDKAESLGWAGRMGDTAWDYLMVVNTNIAGGKSDRKIKEEITHATDVEIDGSVTNILKIKRIHTGIKREDFTGMRNVDWMRIYVPKGSRLIEARGFRQPDASYFKKPDSSWKEDPDIAKEEADAMVDVGSGTHIYNESGKTVFANWSMVDPGETITIYIKYKLPFKLKSDSAEIEENSLVSIFFKDDKKKIVPYAFLVEKQPGSIGSKFNSILRLPDNYKNSWQYPQGDEIIEDGWNKKAVLDVDHYWATLLEIE